MVRCAGLEPSIGMLSIQSLALLSRPVAVRAVGLYWGCGGAAGRFRGRTVTHSGFCSLALAHPALDERQSRSDCVGSTHLLQIGRRGRGCRRGTYPTSTWPTIWGGKSEAETRGKVT